MKKILLAGAAVVGLILLVCAIIAIASDDSQPAPDSSVQNKQLTPLVERLVTAAGVTPTTAPAVDVYCDVDQSMRGFFDAATVPGGSSLEPKTLVGRWQAKVVALDVSPDQPAVDVSDIPPFAFEIAQAGADFHLKSQDGKGTPRVLAATAGGLIARGEGGPDVRLSLRDQVLVGEMTIDKGRMVFHASHAK